MSPFVITGSVSLDLLSWGIGNSLLYAIAGFVVAGLFYLKNVKANIGKSEHLRYNRNCSSGVPYNGVRL